MLLINQLITRSYNTTAVTSLELVEECQKTFSGKREELYRECPYAVYLCMRSDWVKVALASCLDKWDASMEVKRYVTTYLKKMNISPENYNASIQRLVTYLPESIRNENSPIMYKAFRAVQITTNKDFQGPVDFDDKVLQDESYYTTVADCISRNMPLLAAEQFATAKAAKSLNLVESAGLLIGRAVSMKYTFCTSMEAAIRDNLGDKADDFYTRREERKQHREQKKMENELRRAEAQHEEISQRVKVKADEPKPVMSKKPVKKQVVHKDFNPYIPNWLMSVIGGLIISFLCLLLGKFTFVIMLISTSVASYGWFCKDKGIEISGHSPILFMCGGYACAVLCLVFRFS